MSSNKKDYYEVLGVDKNATDDVIRKAYKKLKIKNEQQQKGLL